MIMCVLSPCTCCQTTAAEVETLRDYCLSRDEQLRQLTKELDARKADRGQMLKTQDQALQDLQQSHDSSQVSNSKVLMDSSQVLNDILARSVTRRS